MTFDIHGAPFVRNGNVDVTAKVPTEAQEVIRALGGEFAAEAGKLILDGLEHRRLCFLGKRKKR